MDKVYTQEEILKEQFSNIVKEHQKQVDALVLEINKKTEELKNLDTIIINKNLIKIKELSSLETDLRQGISLNDNLKSQLQNELKILNFEKEKLNSEKEKFVSDRNNHNESMNIFIRETDNTKQSILNREATIQNKESELRSLDILNKNKSESIEIRLSELSDILKKITDSNTEYISILDEIKKENLLKVEVLEKIANENEILNNVRSEIEINLRTVEEIKQNNLNAIDKINKKISELNEKENNIRKQYIGLEIKQRELDILDGKIKIDEMSLSKSKDEFNKLLKLKGE